MLRVLFKSYSFAKEQRRQGVEGKNAVLIFVDSASVGEAAKRPSLRTPALPDGHLQKVVTGTLQGRGATPRKGCSHVDTPVNGDLVIVSDGGRGDESALAPFKAPKTRGAVSTYLEHWEAD